MKLAFKHLLWDLKAVPSGMPCTLTHPTMTILSQIFLIVIGGLLALAGALLTSLLQIRREQMKLDREDQRAEAERFQAHYGQSIQEKRDAYLAFASAIHHASLALNDGPLPDDRLNKLTRQHEAVLLVAPDEVREITIQTFDRFLKAKDAMEFPHLREKRKAEFTQGLAAFRTITRDDLGLHNQHLMPPADRPAMPSDGTS